MVFNPTPPTVLSGELRHRRLVELNVQEQCINLFANPIIQRRQAAHGLPRIHGMVYDVGEVSYSKP